VVDDGASVAVSSGCALGETSAGVSVLIAGLLLIVLASPPRQLEDDAEARPQRHNRQPGERDGDQRAHAWRAGLLIPLVIRPLIRRVRGGDPVASWRRPFQEWQV
jgi:hypothetical protein